MGGRGKQEGSGRGERGLGVIGAGREDDVEEKRGGLRKRGDETIRRNRTVLRIREKNGTNRFIAADLRIEDAVGVDLLRGVGGVDSRLQIPDGGAGRKHDLPRHEGNAKRFCVAAPVLKY